MGGGARTRFARPKLRGEGGLRPLTGAQPPGHPADFSSEI
jgi:hypothetical protein